MVFYKGLSFALFKNNKFYFLSVNGEGALGLLDNPSNDNKYFFPCTKVIYEDAKSFVFRIESDDDLQGYEQLLDEFSSSLEMFHVKKYLFRLGDLPGKHFVRYSLLSKQIVDISNKDLYKSGYCIHSNEDVWMFLQRLISANDSGSGWYFIQISCSLYQVYFCENEIIISSCYNISEISKYFELPINFHDMRLLSDSCFLLVDSQVENDLIVCLPKSIRLFKIKLFSECKIITNNLLKVKGEFCFSDSRITKEWLYRAYFCKRNFIYCLLFICIFAVCCWSYFEKIGCSTVFNSKNEHSSYKLKYFFMFLKNISGLLPVQVSLESIIYEPNKVSIFGNFSRFGALEKIKGNLGKDWLVSSYKQNEFVAINEMVKYDFS